MNKIIIMLGILLSVFFQQAMADGKLLPSHRIVAYYGNFYSKKMGVLGEYPPEQMLKMLRQEVSKWNAADSKTPVIPAIEYIAVVAQNNPGKNGKYIARMPDEHLQKAIALAKKVDGIAIFDIQVGHSNLQTEVPRFAKYLELPNVMLALDPEFALSNKNKPGTKIGTLDAKDINYVINYMAEIVKKHNLPPKILVVHSFTANMITNDTKIKPVPEVQVVVNMDGWGPKSLKLDSYREFVAGDDDLVEFTGVKLFYKNDLKKPSSGLLTPAEILKFKPVPHFIQYQ